MQITCERDGRQYTADLADPLSIAIRLDSDLTRQPNAFGAPPFEAWPVREGTFVGALAEGAAVNFFNVRINPHGNGTHTECVRHIRDIDTDIHTILRDTLMFAEVVSVFPEQGTDGSRRITAQALDALTTADCPGLIVRTLPNPEEKRSRHYTGSNPPFFSPEAIAWMNDRGVRHLLTDLPSVDPEEDGGALKAHKLFWGVPENPQPDKTITELIFVDNDIEDGVYLLNIQIAPLALDVSPSRPLLFRMKPI
ncbi:MAG: cyclase family protein [Saprospiraceae bacterium]|nr:cyclase family protein [Saprospiraceae bacterium]